MTHPLTTPAPLATAAAPWFVALPDTPAGAALASTLQAADPALAALRRPSGRPWLIGRWARDEIVDAVAGRSRMALLGCAPISHDRLAARLARARDLAALDQVALELPGSFHLVAEIEGRQRVQGTASGLRRVFHAALAGAGGIIAGDRADVVAALAGLDRIDVAAVLLCLVDPVAPHPLDDRPLWQGLTAVPPDHCLCVEQGRPSHRRWWLAPEPTLDGVEGAAALRQALVTAVAARTAAGGTVTADLSGGLDSTALCFLAATGPAALVPYTGLGRDPADDDARWAALARAALGVGTFEVLPRDELPLVYEGITGVEEPLDRPFIGVIDRAKLLAGLRLAARHEPRLHLCGLGGDEVAESMPNYLAGLALGHPLAAWARLRPLRAQSRWPLGATLRTLRPRSYRDWLAALARPAGGPPARGRRHLVPPERVAELDWSMPPRIGAWLTPEATELLRATIEQAAVTAEPLGPTRDRHGDLFAIRVGAAVARGFTQLAAPTGPPLAAPFYDDRVIEAALAVRPEERSTPWEYKPLLKAAMAGLVPAACLRRETKAECSAEEEAGLRAHQTALRGLFDGSRLAELGLVDTDRLLGLCRYSAAPDRHYLALQQTAAAESWLRAGGRRPSLGGPPHQSARPATVPAAGSPEPEPLERTC
ncbi:asparagine synthase [Frankia sp. AgB1.9]|uniref:asparagine synthase-related protein n=1 Tax=unclassified Frankia TaxID=2632575 RepID=UPI001932930B|nr:MULTISPECIES: asparagine synthase-related protein [unclassified Frankia]MBL7490375.1 asparagine synthase [Frankia sp. AgW1.1]MBL7552814.1 asparagine synthase [Frankia sp. AgB1.9]MBL7619658.1 asparagine synthase [Frankia sp. AgB1.8]